MNKTITDILEWVEDKIYDRGEDYYESGQIKNLIASADGEYKAEVYGSGGSVYDVFVTTDKNGGVTEFGCNCPYDFGDVCKHLVAVFLAIEDENYKKARISVAKKEPNLTEIVDTLSFEQIKKFVLEYAHDDDRFKNELLLCFGKPQLKSEMAEVKERVRLAIRKGTHSGYIDYSGCDDICNEFMEILDIAQKRMDQGHYMLAFHISLYILLAGVRLASTADSSSGFLTQVIDSSIKIVDCACEAIENQGDRKNAKLIYAKLIKEAKNKVFDGWGESNYDLLRSATRFVTQKNVKALYDTLDYLKSIYSKWTGYYDSDDRLTRLEVIRHLEGKENADKYIKENISIDEFRRIAVTAAIDEKNFAYAEQLCLEKICDEPDHHNPYLRPSEWYYFLYSIYSESGDIEKKIKVAEAILLKNDLSYYDILKSILIGSGRWEEEYTNILQKCADNLHYHYYMEILDKEKEWSLLLEQVKYHPERVFTYGKQLAKEYPEEIYALFHEEIIKEVSIATDRRKYAKVCTSIKALYDAGGTQAAFKLIDAFTAEYKRRPAMLDELSKLYKKLKG